MTRAEATAIRESANIALRHLSQKGVPDRVTLAGGATCELSKEQRDQWWLVLVPAYEEIKRIAAMAEAELEKR